MSYRSPEALPATLLVVSLALLWNRRRRPMSAIMIVRARFKDFE